MSIANLFKSQDLEINTALKHGKEFKRYQKSIAKNINSQNKKFKTANAIVEGFDTRPTNYTQNSQNVLDQNKLNQTQIAELEALKRQYTLLQNEVTALESSIVASTQKYIDISGPNNKYHNKNVRFTGNGKTGYVTNEGAFKWYPSSVVFDNTAGKNGCPTNVTSITNSGDGFDIPGTIIEADPPIIVGSAIQKGQTCGNEGNNVLVNSILPSSVEVKYTGCYTDNLNAPTMTFIGGVPTQQSSIANGNFSQPAISNNSYQYITSQSRIPGWDFNAVLVNNSSAWGYPIPYPSGNQCACIQNTQSISQTLNLSSGTYTLTFFGVGRNCCDGSGQSNPIDIQLNGTTFYNVQPSISKWSNYSKTFNVTTSGNNTLTFLGKWNSGDRSTALQNISISGGSSSGGSYTYSMCKEAAIASGYRYFALQDVNPQTSKGYCAVSNDSIAPTKNGTSYVVSGGVALWSSQTAGNTGCSAILTTQGALSVVQNSTNIFSTPNSNATPSNFLGCYGDNSNRAMALYNRGAQSYNYDQCSSIAKQTGSKYFGLQNSTSGNNAQCGLSNDLAQTIKYGKAGNCTKLSNGTYSGGGTSGGGWSNAVYSRVEPYSNYFLILQDDGNMCIYRGTGPNDNQGTIWCAMTNGKQQKPNPKYAASKGKYGKNYITSGATLAVGDFVGSTNGNTYLIMQSDGNLVLYASQDVVNCSKMSDNNMGGGSGANALYDLGISGFPENVGKIGYVDYDGNLSEYPSSMKGLSTNYSLFRNADSAGNDIGNPIPKTTASACEKKCNTIDNCGGFVFDDNNVCYIKQVGAKRDKLPVSGKDFYYRNPRIQTAPGSTKNISTIDSIQWHNYKNTGKPVSSDSFSRNGIVQRQELDQLTGRLNLLAQQITDKTNQLLSKNIHVGDQLLANKTAFNTAAGDFTAITSLDQTAKINNINEIVKDTDIVTLRENYRYIMWTILAIGVVSISMNVLKKTS